MLCLLGVVKLYWMGVLNDRLLPMDGAVKAKVVKPMSISLYISLYIS